MSGPDEFEDFVARRKPLFPRAPDGLEPPVELDRLVLRQAREAIRPESPEPMYHGTRWGMPVAIAATVLVATTIVLHVGMSNRGPVPQVTVQNITQRTDQAPAQPPSEPGPAMAPARTAAAETTTTTAPQAAPAWRGDARSWMARIEHLRAEGKAAEADAELAEFRKVNRAYAGSPDR